MQTPDRGKSKALRIRLDYYRHSSGLDHLRRLLILAGLALSVAYGVWILVPRGKARSFAMLHVSAGPLAQVHAAFENDCEKCHTHGLAAPLGKNSFQLEPERRLEHQESACKNCHRVDGHWRTALKDPSQDRDCAHCHHEHTGRDKALAQVANQTCAECHRDLQSVCIAGKLDSNGLAIKDFSASTHGVVTANGTAQFRSLLVDRGRIKFDHAQHLRPGQIDAGRRGGMRLEMLPASVRQRLKQPGQSDSDLVVLNCASCHQLHAIKTGSQHAVGSEEGRYYAPINFETHCQACHQMTFPGQTGQMLPLPHVTSLAEYELLLNARSESMRVQSRTEQATQESTVAGKLDPAVTHPRSTDTPRSIAFTMDSLMQRCQQCHLPEDTTPGAIELAMAGQMQPLIPSRWLASGYFDHAAHGRIENCQFCHEIPGTGDRIKPLPPSPPTDQEHVFIRGPESCVICHRPIEATPLPALADAQSTYVLFGQGHQPTWASDDCTLCHRYHWTSPDAIGTPSAPPLPAKLGEVESSRSGEIREGAMSRYESSPFGNTPKPAGASPGSPQLPAGQLPKVIGMRAQPLLSTGHAPWRAAENVPSRTGASALRLSGSRFNRSRLGSSWLSASSLSINPSLSLSAIVAPRSNVAEPTAKWVGRASCGTATCHGGVVDSAAIWHASATVWEARDPHAHAGLRLQETLARSIVINLEPTAQQDAALFEQTVHKRCVSCHAPESQSSPQDHDWSRRLLHGVGCEACHGAAGRWMDAHTRSDFDSRHESARALGMLDTKSLTPRVENCVRCHIGSRSADGLVRDVNHDLIAAGHPRMLFDPLVMQSKLPPHWDTRTGAAMAVAATEASDANQTARRVVLEVVSRLKHERRSSPDRLPTPEFSEYDCRTCHRPLAGKGGA